MLLYSPEQSYVVAAKGVPYWCLNFLACEHALGGHNGGLVEPIEIDFANLYTLAFPCGA